MSWGSNEKEIMLMAENASMLREIEWLKEQVADLKEDRKSLREQLKHTQEALIAKESPEVYRDKKYVEDLATAQPLTEEQKESRKLREQQAEITSRYINEMEGDLFKDASDMQQILTRVVGAPLSESKSIHNNNES